MEEDRVSQIRVFYGIISNRVESVLQELESGRPVLEDEIEFWSRELSMLHFEGYAEGYLQ